MNRKAQKPLQIWKAYSECPDCNETCRRGKEGPPESVQILFTQHFQHIGKLFNFLGQPILYLSVPQNVRDTQITVVSS